MSEENRFKDGNQAALKTGAGAAEVALTAREPLRDEAAVMARAVEAELATDGVDELARRGAIRLQAVADLYFQAIEGATDIGRLDQLVKRWGWIQNSALRAWAQVRADSRSSKHDAARVIAAMREANSDTDANE